MTVGEGIHQPMYNYWRQIAQRAFVETCRILGLEARTQIFIKFLVAIVVVAALFLFGSSDASRDEMIVRIALAAIVVLAFPFVWAWKFVSLPARTESELSEAFQQSTASLQAQIDDLKKVIEPRLTLSNVTYDEIHDMASRSNSEYTFLIVENKGTTQLEKCMVKIEKYIDGNGLEHEAHAALYTEARSRDGKPGRFILAGGEKKRVMLTIRETSDIRRPGLVRIPSEQGDFILSRGQNYYLYLVGHAEEGQPSCKIAKVFVDEWYKAKVEFLDNNPKSDSATELP